MPLYPVPNMTQFRALLLAANPTIESGLKAKVFGKSALQPLVALLTNAATTELQVYQAIASLSHDTTQKYRTALSYLLTIFRAWQSGASMWTIC